MVSNIFYDYSVHIFSQQLLNDPVSWGECGHSFCLVCAHTAFSASTACPNCRQTTSKPGAVPLIAVSL